jgi:hypothetical protein
MLVCDSRGLVIREFCKAGDESLERLKIKVNHERDRGR